jgi:hypothetical protein
MYEIYGHIRCIVIYEMEFAALIHSLHSSIRCTHPFAALIHSLHSSIRCTHPFAVLIHSLYSSIRCTHPFAALIHSLYSSIRYTHLDVLTRASRAFYVEIRDDRSREVFLYKGKSRERENRRPIGNGQRYRRGYRNIIG